MSDDAFLKRWSRRKRADTPPAGDVPVEKLPSNLPPQAGEGSSSYPPPLAGEGRVGGTPPAPGPSEKDEAIDPAMLPPLESLGPDSDYTVFLRKGVPEALKLAALRKAWMSDPFIREFRSPAIEYGWDFTTPDYSLRATDDVEKLLDQILPRETKPPAGAPTAAAAEPTPSVGDAPAPAKPELPPAARPDLSLPQIRANAPEAPKSAATVASAPRRKHGGALPS